MPLPPEHRYPKPVRAGLADQVIEHLLQDISSGVYAIGARLPSEAVLAEQTHVSRLTLREAIKGLSQRGVVRVEQGRGTFVNPPSEWLAFDPMLLATMVSRDETLGLALQLTEVRSIVEVGAAELAARRRHAPDLAAMRGAIQGMRDAQEQEDAELFSRADIEFHDAVLHAAGNEFVAALLAPVHAGLRAVRTQTSRGRRMNERAIVMHTQIYEMIRNRAPRKAANSMSRHLRETENYISGMAADS